MRLYVTERMPPPDLSAYASARPKLIAMLSKDGGWRCTTPLLPAMTTYGKTERIARRRAAKAVREARESGRLPK